MHESTSPDALPPTSPDPIIAFNHLYKEYYASLVFFARKLVRDRPAAEDIVTDVFIKLWEKQLHFDLPMQAKAFLYISTRNACLNHLQRSGHEARSLEGLAQTSATSQDNILREILRAELLRQLARVVESLPAQCRKVVRMSYLQGYSNREIASKLQLSINTVRNQKVRGIWLLRKRMD